MIYSLLITNLILFLTLSTTALNAILPPAFSTHEPTRALDNAWSQFKIDFMKIYETEEHELERRLIWEKNLVKIRAHNFLYSLGKYTYTVDMNHLGDYHSHEIANILNGYRPELRSKPETLLNLLARPPPESFQAPGNFTPPESVDWRTKQPNVVTPVKNQGQCGSCWAFSSTGALEGQHAIKYGKLVSLSEQNLVDCSAKEGNEGCNGGLMDQAFDYIRLNGGIDTEAAYPYKGREGKCVFTPKSVGANDTGFVDIPTGNETALTAALALVGPISVAIDASQFGFQFYKTGVYYDASCSSKQLDHGVLAVGYGSTKQITLTSDNSSSSSKPKPKPASGDYYIVKNSWGPSWGASGYILMTRNRSNNCGIATAASYPKV